jgi:hypothetical protein
LYPKPVGGFEFYGDALKWVGLLFGIASFGMLYSFYIYLQRGVNYKDIYKDIWSISL